MSRLRLTLAGILLTASSFWLPAQPPQQPAQTPQQAAQPAQPTQTAQQMVEKLPAPTDYISDLANVIDASSAQQIDALCSQLDHQAHAQIAVVTIDSLNGNSIEEFATALEDKWKVGPKATDRGLLMIFAIKDHKRRIEVGYGLEGILNDAKVGDIGRSMKPQLEQGQYGPAIFGGLQQLSTVIAADAGVTLTPIEQQHTYHYQTAPQHGLRIGSIIRILVFLFVLIAAISGRGRSGNGWLWFLLGNMMGGGSGGGRDRGDWGGGGSGGGGGFGGFGGGGSGGGGASGDW